MRAREPGLQAVSNIAGSMIKNTHFFPLLILFRDMISNIGKSTRHYRCLYSEGKAIKLILYLSQNTHFCKLRAILIIGWQALEGILGLGLTYQDEKTQTVFWSLDLRFHHLKCYLWEWRKGHFHLLKWPFLHSQKWYSRCPKRKSKSTFIDQIYPPFARKIASTFTRSIDNSCSRRTPNANAAEHQIRFVKVQKV